MGRSYLFVANNFSHNLIASALTLPTSLLENDLDHVVNGQGSASLWAPGWNGKVSLEAVVLLLFELLLIALGVGYCWSRWKMAGLAPFLICLAYLLALGLARTSGGRYIVPADWATYFYFGLGLVQIGRWAASLRKPTLAGQPVNPAIKPVGETRQGEGSWRGGLAAMGIVFLVGLSLPLASTFFSDPFLVETKSGVLQILAEDGLLDKLGYTTQDIQGFTSNPDSFVAYGRAFFPRYLDNSTDAYAKEIYNDLPKTTPHLVLEMIVPTAWFTIDLPLESSPAYFPNAADVIVLGCKPAHYVDGLVVVILGPRPVIYQASPNKTLSCP